MTNNDMYDLSVIIPHYNSPKLLDVLLESLGAHPGVEILVVDDKSDKELAEFEKCKRKYGENVTFLTNNGTGKNAGAARNVGLKEAHGKWLLFADADDYFLPGWYETVQACLNAEEDIVFFTSEAVYRYTGEKSGRVVYYNRYCDNFAKGKKGSEAILRRDFGVPWSKLVRTEVVTQNDIWFDEVEVSNDTMFSVKTGFYAEKIRVCETPIYCYTEGASLLTSKESFQMNRVRCTVVAEKYLFLKEHHAVLNVTEPLSLVIHVMKYNGFRKAKEACRYFKSRGIPVFTFRSIFSKRMRYYVKVALTMPWRKLKSRKSAKGITKNR